MKKLLVFVMALMLVFTSAAVAEEAEKTVLPMGVAFRMNAEEVVEALGKDAVFQSYDPEFDPDAGEVYLVGQEIKELGLTAEDLFFEIQRNNSEKAARLSAVTVFLPTGDNCIAAFRQAHEKLTALYGASDSDPFSPEGVEAYVEFGSLNATWTKKDVRINLSMQRAFEEQLTLDFTDRLCYNPDDLK